LTRDVEVTEKQTVQRTLIYTKILRQMQKARKKRSH